MERAGRKGGVENKRGYADKRKLRNKIRQAKGGSYGASDPKQPKKIDWQALNAFFKRVMLEPWPGAIRSSELQVSDPLWAGREGECVNKLEYARILYSLQNMCTLGKFELVGPDETHNSFIAGVAKEVSGISSRARGEDAQVPKTWRVLINFGNNAAWVVFERVNSEVPGVLRYEGLGHTSQMRINSYVALSSLEYEYLHRLYLYVAVPRRRSLCPKLLPGVCPEDSLESSHAPGGSLDLGNGTPDSLNTDPSAERTFGGPVSGAAEFSIPIIFTGTETGSCQPDSELSGEDDRKDVVRLGGFDWEVSPATYEYALMRSESGAKISSSVILKALMESHEYCDDSYFNLYPELLARTDAAKTLPADYTGVAGADDRLFGNSNSSDSGFSDNAGGYDNSASEDHQLPEVSRSTSFLEKHTISALYELMAVEAELHGMRRGILKRLCLENIYPYKLTHTLRVAQQTTARVRACQRLAQFRRIIFSMIKHHSKPFLDSKPVLNSKALPNAPPSGSAGGENFYSQAPAAENSGNSGESGISLVFCSVCLISEQAHKHVLLQCRRCRMLVHYNCYANLESGALEPSTWLCDVCKDEGAPEEVFAANRAICAVCCTSGGAMKKVDCEPHFNTFGGAWIHLICAALLVPSVYCKNWVALSNWDISALRGLKSQRCSICMAPCGFFISCKFPQCGVKMHPLCAWLAGVFASVKPLYSKSFSFNNSADFCFTPFTIEVFCVLHSASEFAHGVVKEQAQSRCKAYLHYLHSPCPLGKQRQPSKPLVLCPSPVTVTLNGTVISASHMGQSSAPAYPLQHPQFYAERARLDLLAQARPDFTMGARAPPPGIHGSGMQSGLQAPRGKMAFYPPSRADHSMGYCNFLASQQGSLCPRASAQGLKMPLQPFFSAGSKPGDHPLGAQLFQPCPAGRALPAPQRGPPNGISFAIGGMLGDPALSNSSAALLHLDSLRPAVCTVCYEELEAELLLQCRKCGLHVHQKCYFPFEQASAEGAGAPAENFFCQACESGQESPECVICKSRGGAMMLASMDDRPPDPLLFVHVSCGIFAGLATARSASGMRYFCKLSQLRAPRAGTCEICGGLGVTLACNQQGCAARLHISCAKRCGCFLEFGHQGVFAFCVRHSEARSSISPRLRMYLKLMAFVEIANIVLDHLPH